MNIRRALAGSVVVALAYPLLLVWLDSRSGLLGQLSVLVSHGAVLLAATGVSLILRFLRWHWLLYRIGYRLRLETSAAAYAAGFAFTATPGKVGELLRIRYLTEMSVPPTRVIAAFVFERLIDLVTVLVLALPLALEFSVFRVAASFVGIVALAVGVLAFNFRHALRIVLFLRRWRLRRLARLVGVMGAGLRDVRLWGTLPDLLLSITLGLAAWTTTAWSFLILLNALGVAFDFWRSLALYPLAILVGAASMLPGGMGSTEATLVLLLNMDGVPVLVATLAAVGIRLVTLWFAMLIGMICFGFLEWRRRSNGNGR